MSVISIILVILVAFLADPPQPLLAPGAVGFRCQAQPGGEVTAPGEHPRIRDTARNQVCRDRPHALDAHQTTADSARTAAGDDLLFKHNDPCIKLIDLLLNALHMAG